MATIGLKGVWGLEQLDRTRIATWKLGILLVGGSTFVGVLLIPILGDVNPDSVVLSRYSARAISLTLVMVSFS